jgi:hypothetical protein
VCYLFKMSWPAGVWYVVLVFVIERANRIDYKMLVTV